ncbi:uncharacterized protein LOC131591842 isoform X2 [Poecile atricapillus]|uniref:uncharacterized protein LOC131591842 isoform X2 n=1 Tax=Poecile atricapillus TaxID=48891 RepID=UPI0027388678|nr:uncharacterized protein LOC131591842 isoform X2 [Poecile atricapillus]
MGQRAELLFLPVRLHKSFRHGGGRRIVPAAPLCFPSRPRGPADMGARPASRHGDRASAPLPVGATTRATRRAFSKAVCRGVVRPDYGRQGRSSVQQRLLCAGPVTSASQHRRAASAGGSPTRAQRQRRAGKRRESQALS